MWPTFIRSGQKEGFWLRKIHFGDSCIVTLLYSLNWLFLLLLFSMQLKLFTSLWTWYILRYDTRCWTGRLNLRILHSDMWRHSGYVSGDVFLPLRICHTPEQDPLSFYSWPWIEGCFAAACFLNGWMGFRDVWLTKLRNHLEQHYAGRFTWWRGGKTTSCLSKTKGKQRLQPL